MSQSLPGIIIPAIMGTFGTTKTAQWEQLLPLNCAVVILSNLLYIAFISTEPADWEPEQGTHTSMDSILERCQCQYIAINLFFFSTAKSAQAWPG